MGEQEREGHCSDGQQRRVTLTCALFQRPSLFILDQPTVGVDPLLREKFVHCIIVFIYSNRMKFRIWSYLIDISPQSKTTMIITHFIEEARKASRVSRFLTNRMWPNEVLFGEVDQKRENLGARRIISFPGEIQAKTSLIFFDANLSPRIFPLQSLKNFFLHLCFNDQTVLVEQSNSSATTQMISFSTPRSRQVNNVSEHVLSGTTLRTHALLFERKHLQCTRFAFCESKAIEKTSERLAGLSTAT